MTRMGFNKLNESFQQPTQKFNMQASFIGPMAAGNMPKEELIGETIISSEPRFRDLWENP